MIDTTAKTIPLRVRRRHALMRDWPRRETDKPSPGGCKGKRRTVLYRATCAGFARAPTSAGASTEWPQTPPSPPIVKVLCGFPSRPTVRPLISPRIARPPEPKISSHHAEKIFIERGDSHSTIVGLRIINPPTINHRERLWDRGARSRPAHLRFCTKKNKNRKRFDQKRLATVARCAQSLPSCVSRRSSKRVCSLLGLPAAHSSRRIAGRPIIRFREPSERQSEIDRLSLFEALDRQSPPFF